MVTLINKDKLWDLALKYSNENPKGILEIFERAKNGRCKDIVQYALDKNDKSTTEKVIDAVSDIAKNQKALNKGVNNVVNLQKETLNAINNMQFLNKAGILLSSANLVATSVGFAIMNEKLNKIQNSIDSLWSDVKKINEIHTEFKYNEVVDEYSDMLYHRRTNRLYTQDQYKDLVSSEYNIIDMYIKNIKSGVAYDSYTMLQSLFSMVLFFGATVILYDRVCYFENKESAKNGNVWHDDHDKWLKIFDYLESDEFKKIIQDYAFIYKNLDSHTTDIFVNEFMKQIHDARQGIIDNQQLLLLCDKGNDLSDINEIINEEACKTIKQVIPVDSYQIVDEYNQETALA